jgi:hypothetical protein
MKTSIKIVLFIVIFIALSAILAALYMYNMKHTDMTKSKPDFVITASQLQKEFEDDETAATTRYVKKVLEVTGTIVSIKPAANGILSISFETGSNFSSVICTFTANTDSSKFKNGDIIIVRGECSGFLLDVLLNNCALIENKKKL